VFGVVVAGSVVTGGVVVVVAGVVVEVGVLAGVACVPAGCFTVRLFFTATTPVVLAAISSARAFCSGVSTNPLSMTVPLKLSTLTSPPFTTGSCMYADLILDVIMLLSMYSPVLSFVGLPEHPFDSVAAQPRARTAIRGTDSFIAVIIVGVGQVCLWRHKCCSAQRVSTPGHLSRLLEGKLAAGGQTVECAINIAKQLKSCRSPIRAYQPAQTKRTPIVTAMPAMGSRSLLFS
jgi:hypothetical protein